MHDREASSRRLGAVAGEEAARTPSSRNASCISERSAIVRDVILSRQEWNAKIGHRVFAGANLSLESECRRTQLPASGEQDTA